MKYKEFLDSDSVYQIDIKETGSEISSDGEFDNAHKMAILMEDDSEVLQIEREQRMF